jgi:dipeptidyl aminopeptidase/acylaminoacyl peptidase
MKRALVVVCCALLLAACSGVKGRITLKSQSLDGKVTAIVSQEGEDNSRDAVYHVYLAPTAGGTPDEVVWTERASQVYVRWDDNDHIVVVLNGGELNFTRSNDTLIPVPVDGGERKIGIWVSFAR